MSLTCARVLQISGRDFLPVANKRPKQCKWLDGFVDGVPHPHLTDPYEAGTALKQHLAWTDREAALHPPFVPASARKHLDAVPTQAMQGSMMDLLVSTICSDWEQIQVRPFSSFACEYCTRVHVVDNASLVQ